MTNQEMLHIAMAQSGEDLGCRPEDFLAEGPMLRPFRMEAWARKYLKPAMSGCLVSYSQGLVAAVKEEIADILEGFITEEPYYHLLETPALCRLDEQLKERGHGVSYMSQYFLPVEDRIPSPVCAYEKRLLGPADFSDLYSPAWSNALCEKRKELDVLGVGAYDHGKLIGLAACSADCEKMWQIGVDVLPAYRRQGVASALTAALTREIMQREKVPFYGCAWANLPSVRNAIRSGFRPAWVEVSII